jgi:HD-GYP domain-containing protein (c-di-GMP phosphodiesterase class II)
MDFDSVMAIMNKKTGSHFDPSVMQVFQPMARNVFDHLTGRTGDDMRRLLEDLIRHYFKL